MKPAPSEAYAAQFSGFDLIGDVHGCAHTLTALLEKMNYQRGASGYAHPDRLAVFLGDIVDRGPHIREAVALVKEMVDGGHALCLMGNHEYNALAWSTQVGASDSGEPLFLRPHISRNRRLISETLAQFADYQAEWRVYLDWFKTLPFFLELPCLRAVHACWDHELIDMYRRRTGGNTLTEGLFESLCNGDHFANVFVDRITRGTNFNLPEGITIRGRDGFTRRSFRVKFWSRTPERYRDVVFQPDPLPEALADRPLNEEERARLLSYGESEPPVFVGHYWLQGRPRPLRRNVVCLDYSAVKYGRLAAYRFDGEAELSAEKFVWVYVDPETHATTE